MNIFGKIINSLSPDNTTHKEGVLYVRLPNHYRACNFHCPYCISDLHSDANRYKWPWRDNHKKIISNLAKIDYKINVRLGPAGEFFLSKELVQDARWLSNQPNVQGVNLITNLSFPLTKYRQLLSGFDLSKVGIVVSFHPTEVNNFDNWLQVAVRLNEIVELSIVVVAYPPLLFLFHKYVSSIKQHQIPVSINGFIGTHNGKAYPYSYSDLEKFFCRQLSFSRHEYEFWIVGRKPGLCNAGYKSIFVDIANGNVFSCGMPKRFYLGNILEHLDFNLLDDARPCMNDNCLCDSENFNPVVFDKYYKRTGVSLRKYKYKYQDLSRDFPQADEWNIAYW